MKQLALLICVCALFSLAAKTQSIGIHAGTNISTFDNPKIQPTYHSWWVGEASLPSEEEWVPLVGFQAGLTLHREVNSFMDLTSGINYVQRGGKHEVLSEFGGFPREFKGEVKITSIEIPLSIRFNYKRENISFYASAGTSASIGLAAKVKSLDKRYSNSGVTFSNIEFGPEELTFGSGDDDELEKLTLGLNPAVGVQWKSFFLDLGYYYGLEDISADEDYELTQRSISLSLGVIINSNKG